MGMNKNKLKAQFLLKGKVLGMRMENKETNFHKYIADKWIDVEVFDNYPTKEEILEAVNQSEEEIDSVHIKLVYKVEEENNNIEVDGWEYLKSNKDGSYTLTKDAYVKNPYVKNPYTEDVVPIEEQGEFIKLTEESEDGIDTITLSSNYATLLESVKKNTKMPFWVTMRVFEEENEIGLTRDQLELLQVKMKEVLDAYDNLVDKKED